MSFHIWRLAIRHCKRFFNENMMKEKQILSKQTQLLTFIRPNESRQHRQSAVCFFYSTAAAAAALDHDSMPICREELRLTSREEIATSPDRDSTTDDSESMTQSLQ